jgi:hypothetical protein
VGAAALQRKVDKNGIMIERRRICLLALTVFVGMARISLSF